ncbi:response regulator [Herbaspirillum sp. AP02]|uniref:response regulator n=1 Tax=unclassified Herbaspirillum TaxID=2624150 RepID=UPI0015D9F36B|nr:MULTISPECIES: response regulator [unclassified Herbaspirillum]MBG7619094.1 response regulator [Herbaspirillum sp. AP02]NZD66378.1 response regulator [Herbaspirillum sp. AP21]
MQRTEIARTVLVVEDNTDVRALFCEVLRTEGYVVLEAANGAQAYHLLLQQQQRVDVVLTDLRMPVMDGLALATKLKSHEQLAAIPVVLLSATPMKNAWQARENFAALLTKPCAFTLLLSTIEAVL